MHMFGEKKGK